MLEGGQYSFMNKRLFSYREEKKRRKLVLWERVRMLRQRRRGTEDLRHPPERCPQMGDCEAEVTYLEWDGFCNSSLWIRCENLKEKYKKKYCGKPRIWMLVDKLDGRKERIVV